MAAFLILPFKFARVASRCTEQPAPGTVLIGLKERSLAPAAVYLTTAPKVLLAFWPIKILSCESVVTPQAAPNPSPPIHLPILAELSTKIKILAATSPSPAPGGTGLAFTLLVKNKVNKKISNFKCLNIV